MNSQRFDAMTWHLGTVNSRRRTLAALLAAMGSTIFRSSQANLVAARHKKKKKPAQCGTNTPCPPETPCCIKGTCQPLCGDSCCEDCFAEILAPDRRTRSGSPGLLRGRRGHRLQPGCTLKEESQKERKKKKDDPANDLCCYPSDTCVKGVCCCNGCQGTMVCGDECCAIASCCNGKCCQNGQVCAYHPARSRVCFAKPRL